MMRTRRCHRAVIRELKALCRAAKVEVCQPRLAAEATLKRRSSSQYDQIWSVTTGDNASNGIPRSRSGAEGGNDEKTGVVRKEVTTRSVAVHFLRSQHGYGLYIYMYVYIYIYTVVSSRGQ